MGMDGDVGSVCVCVRRGVGGRKRAVGKERIENRVGKMGYRAE